MRRLRASPQCPGTAGDACRSCHMHWRSRRSDLRARVQLGLVERAVVRSEGFRINCYRLVVNFYEWSAGAVTPQYGGFNDLCRAVTSTTIDRCERADDAGLMRIEARRLCANLSCESVLILKRRDFQCQNGSVRCSEWRRDVPRLVSVRNLSQLRRLSFRAGAGVRRLREGPASCDDHRCFDECSGSNQDE